MQSLMGEIHLQRPYYHCRSCGSGHCPWDGTLGFNERSFSRAAQEVVALVGVQVSFPKGSERMLQKVSGLRVSESTTQRTTEDAGERLAQLLVAGEVLGQDSSWTWQPDAQGRRCAYVSLDATGVRQQGAGGKAADGRMAYVAKIYTPQGENSPRPPQPQERYLAGFYELDELGLQLRRQAAQVGWDDADEFVALSDGGSGLEDFFAKNFPRATCILDFWHAKEHLVEFSLAWFADDEQSRQAWLDEQCHRLKHEGGAAVLAELETMPTAGRSETCLAAHHEHTTYFRNHHHRMDYPTYRAHGWQIGSGPIEAACKTVVGERLKCSGMRWGSDGADAVCHLRALFLSEPSQWDAFWRDHPN